MKEKEDLKKLRTMSKTELIKESESVIQKFNNLLFGNASDVKNKQTKTSLKKYQARILTILNEKND